MMMQLMQHECEGWPQCLEWNIRDMMKCSVEIDLHSYFKNALTRQLNQYLHPDESNEFR